MFLKELEIKNILNCQSLHLFFDKETQPYPIYVIQSESSCPVRNALCVAVQLLCSSLYANLQSVLHLKDIQKGRVRLVLLMPKVQNKTNYVEESEEENELGPSTSQQSLKRKQQNRSIKGMANKGFYKLSACRNFLTSAETVEYSVNDGPIRTCTPAAFHGTFFINVDYLLPQLGQVRLDNTFHGNWLQLFTTEIYGEWNQSENFFEYFVKLFLKSNLDSEHLLSKLTTSCLTENAALNLVKKSYICKVFKDIRNIFEFITCGGYTVWFLIPYKGELITVQNLSAEELDFENIQTYIQLKSEQERKEYVWTEAEHFTKDLLLIACQLAMAFHCKQNVVYLQKLDAVKNHQALEMATAAYLQKHESIEINWTSKNYLQRIIDVCVDINVMAIIEYPGGLPVPLVKAHVIKCYKDNNIWNLKLTEERIDPHIDRLDSFVDNIERGLKK